jgi:enoyl-CoA hydratase
MTHSATTLLVEELPDRVVVTLDRPAVRNAIDTVMVTELHGVCELLEARPKPLLLKGSGGVFAAGADIAELRERGREDALQGINGRLFDRIAALPMPTLAVVDGPALGGGAELAYACDLRLASPSAVFGNPEPGLGIVAAAGASWRLAELVGRSVAKQVLLAGVTIDAERALQFGLVLEIVEPDGIVAGAHAYIDRMLRSSALALQLTKALVDSPSDAHPIADRLAQAVLFETEDKRARMTAFLDKRRR